MAYLQEQMEILKFDKRLLEINLKNGSITNEQYKQFLSQLEDVESQSEKINLDDSSAPAAQEEAVVTTEPATSAADPNPYNNPY